MESSENGANPLVSIVIPHIGSNGVLFDCLNSIDRSTYKNHEIIVVDNGSQLEPDQVNQLGLQLRYIRNEKNLGYAGGCNVGIKEASGKYVVLLNNDTVVDPGWLEPLVFTMENDRRVAACQPRLLSIRNRNKFDYAGAMGGLIDVLGYPFAIGRLFDSIESDNGNYLGSFEIFWASGCASIWRKVVFEEIGLLDEDFFAHMEEIDLNWRAQLSGYRIRSNSDSRVYHYAGYSLHHENWKKMYLNHRNNLIMLLKNYQLTSLLWIYPARFMLELITAAAALAIFDFKRCYAVIAAQLYVVSHIGRVLEKRSFVQKLRSVSDTELINPMFFGSIVWHYYVRRHRKVSDFLKVRPL